MSNIGREIVVIPHCYDIRWAQDLNRALASRFKCFALPEPRTYLPGRSQQLRYAAEVLPVLRKGGYMRLFFANLLDDFSPSYLIAGGIKEIYGFVHGSDFLPREPGYNVKLQQYERGVAGLADGIFTGSKWFADLIPYPATPIGLPLGNRYHEPVDSTRILWNHRLAREKSPLSLLDLPSDLQKDLVVCAAKTSTVYLKRLREELPVPVYLNPDRYYALMGACGIELSFSIEENFPMAVMEAAARGLLPFAPNKTSNCDILIPELLYESMQELVEKVRYYRDHREERFALVRKQQETMGAYLTGPWLDRLESLLGA